MGGSKAKIVAIAIAFMILPVITVTIRVWCKISREAKLAIDDYLILVALLLTIGTGVCQIAATILGNLGQHLTYTASPVVPDQYVELVKFFQIQYALELQAQFALACAKLSLICLYGRIFTKRGFRIATWLVGSLVCIWGVAFWLAFVFSCMPIRANWDFATTNAKCIDKILMWKAYAISDVLTDVMILSMPIPAVLGLQMATRQKIGVMCIFLLGSIVIATGITRVVFFFMIAKLPFTDITYDAAPTVYWSMIETSLSTVCACLPTLRLGSLQRSAMDFAKKIHRHVSSRLSNSSNSEVASLESGSIEKSPAQALYHEPDKTDSRKSEPIPRTYVCEVPSPKYKVARSENLR